MRTEVNLIRESQHGSGSYGADWYDEFLSLSRADEIIGVISHFLWSESEYEVYLHTRSNFSLYQWFSIHTFRSRNFEEGGVRFHYFYAAIYLIEKR